MMEVTQITLEDAKEIKPDVELGGVIEESHEVTSFGRVAAQTAKQVILQRLREAEREVVLAEFEDKIGTVVTGVVQRRTSCCARRARQSCRYHAAERANPRRILRRRTSHQSIYQGY